MDSNNLIRVEQFCSNCEVEYSFIDSLHNHGIVELIVLENEKYISHEQLSDVERAIRFHYELNINMEGIDVISNLLKQIGDLQQELMLTKNRLKLFDLE
jgi:chaperone modulatory protein CbpM